MAFGMGLNKNRHGTYEARKKVPTHLEEAVARVLGNGKAKQVWLKRSLATKDHSEAKRRVKAVQIEFDRVLERAQQLLAERPLQDTISEAEVKLIADRHYAEMLHLDDEAMREGIGRDELRRSIAKQLDDAGIEYWTPIPPFEEKPEFGLSDSEAHKRIADLEFEKPIMQAALARGDVSKVNEHLDYLLNGLFGINLDPRSEAYRRVGLAVLRKHVAALEAIKRRTEGQPVDTPPLPAIGSTSPTAGVTLTVAFEGWKRDGNRSPQTLLVFEYAIKLFGQLHGNLPVAQIRKSHAREFREALRDVPVRRFRTGKLRTAVLPELAQWGREHPEALKMAPSTINKLLGGVQAVGRWARDADLIPEEWADPFAGIRIDEDQSARAPFDIEELHMIFNTPVFTEGERPEGGQGEAAFWLPLLALFTGARLGELAGLRASEVAHDASVGAVCVYITADAKAGKRLKTKQSARAIPIHSQLIELGFLKFVAAEAKARGEREWLFPQVAPGTTGARAFSKWFGRYVGAQGVTDTAKVFHSFRHNFTDALRVADVAEGVSRALVGHAQGGVHGRYGAKDMAARYRHRLAEAIARVAYTGLDLSSLSCHRTSRGTAGAA
ncbi:MAG: tyrosine-type recombinase/integrase [Xanthobacteraceae bacterium]